MQHLAFFRFILLVLGLYGCIGISQARTLTIAADIWCPISCAEQASQQGIGIDLMRAIFEPKGYTIHYIIMPWSRALEQVRQGHIDAVIGTNRVEDAGLIYPVQPLYEMADDFYAVQNASFHFNGIESLKQQRIGVIKGYGYSQSVREFIAKYQKTPGMIQEVGGDDALEQNIKKLLAGHVSVVIESAPIMDYTLHSLHLEQQVKHIGSIEQKNDEGKIYIAFSPALKTSKFYARTLDETVAVYRTKGMLKPLYERYGLHP